MNGEKRNYKFSFPRVERGRSAAPTAEGETSTPGKGQVINGAGVLGNFFKIQQWNRVMGNRHRNVKILAKKYMKIYKNML